MKEDDDQPIDLTEVRADDEKVTKLSAGEPVDDDDPLTPLIQAWIEGLTTEGAHHGTDHG